MADVASLEQQLAALEKKKRGLITKEQRLKSQLSAEKRKQENHCKMVLGGAVYGFVKEDLPEDRKDLELYGWAVKTAIEKDPNFLATVKQNYERLKAEQAESVGTPTISDGDQVTVFDVAPHAGT